MQRIIRATVLPTMVFAALGVLVPSDPRSGLLLRYGPVLTALVFVPLAWNGYVMRQGRGRVRRAALAGGTCAFLIPTASYNIAGAWWEATHYWWEPGLGAAAGALGWFFIVCGSLIVAAPVGALIGMLLAWIQNRWLRDVSQPTDARPAGPSGAQLGAMIATLVSPLVGVVIGVALIESTRGILPGRAIGIHTMMVGTWLVTIPTAAVIGGWLGSRARVARDPWAT